MPQLVECAGRRGPEQQILRIQIKQQRRNQQTDEKLVPYLRLTMPPLFFLEDENTEIATLETDLGNFVNSAMAKFVTGELDLDKDWDEYLAKLENIGLNEYIAASQTCYDRMQAG